MAEQQVVNNILVSSNSELHEFNIDVNRTGDDLACDLIECIQNYPILWNITLRGYKDIHRKEQAWREMSAKLNYDGEYYFSL